MHKKSCFWKLFDNTRVNECQKLLKSAGKYFYSTFSSVLANLSWKKLLLLRYKILGEFNRENSLLPIQMQLFEKSKTFCQYFIASLESKLNFEHVEIKKTELMSLCWSIPEVIDSKRRAYLRTWLRHKFWNLFDNITIKKSQKLPKSPE